ncbi:7147_t:CDS:2, partial [Funneliformis mosseae]
DVDIYNSVRPTAGIPKDTLALLSYDIIIEYLEKAFANCLALFTNAKQ